MMMHDALNTYLLKRNDIKYTLLQERLSNTQQTSPAGMFSSTVSLRKAQHTMLTQWYVCVHVPIIHKLTIKVFIHKRYKNTGIKKPFIALIKCNNYRHDEVSQVLSLFLSLSLQSHTILSKLLYIGIGHC